ncbi:rifin [Plasmodium falciparum IGH-CR14]|uniref:Rifin n=1 Tax=Plasmodium falciparum IGH-CR14 TaxID=580059 RepID=A0A0L1I3Q5_PLAFA|nr:rifin [Plasmodium falciparum IGH-CR14]
MKIHYINILLFELPLNILIYNQRNHKSTTHHTPKIPTARLLCECELYAPSNYDSDPEMKRVMQQFVDRTTQRFHEYDERMKTTRQKCKEQCDKEIQKIILKDKLEKQMEQQFVTLHTDIQSGELPECTCKKSMADKVEKGCLRCGYGLGTVAPTVGLIGSVAVHVWKPVALKAAIKAALNAAANHISAAAEAAGELAGKEAVIGGLKKMGISTLDGNALGSFIDEISYTNVPMITDAINTTFQRSCLPNVAGPGPGSSLGSFRILITDPTFCDSVLPNPLLTRHSLDRVAIKNAIKENVETVVSQAKGAAGDKVAETKEKNEEKTPIYKTIRRIDMMCLVVFDVGRINTTNTMNSKNIQHITKYNNYT